MTTVPFPSAAIKPVAAFGAEEKAPAAAPRPRKTVWTRADFTLVALVLLLAVTASFTAIGQLRHRQARTRFAEDLTRYSAAFQAYVREHESAPPDAPAGQLPAGMEAYLAPEDWSAPTSGGGIFRWEKTASRPGATADQASGRILLTAFPPGPVFDFSTADLEAIDRQIDDGDLTTGRFRRGFMGWPTLVVSAPR